MLPAQLLPEVRVAWSGTDDVATYFAVIFDSFGIEVDADNGFPVAPFIRS